MQTQRAHGSLFQPQVDAMSVKLVQTSIHLHPTFVGILVIVEADGTNGRIVW